MHIKKYWHDQYTEVETTLFLCIASSTLPFIRNPQRVFALDASKSGLPLCDGRPALLIVVIE
jgi:hypothetical protein